jgi:cell division protein FtsN
MSAEPEPPSTERTPPIAAPPAATASPATPREPRFFVQFGTFRSAANAEHQCAELSGLAEVAVQGSGDGKWFLCRTKTALGAAEARRLALAAQQVNVASVMLVAASRAAR